MIRVAPGVAIDGRFLEETFIRASGPGGQNVNKVASAVQLRLPAEACVGLDEAARARLKRLAGRRMTVDGELVLTARRHRTQERNRRDALARLVALVAAAAAVPVTRRKTAPTAGSRERRLKSKRLSATKKRRRKKRPPEADG